MREAAGGLGGRARLAVAATKTLNALSRRLGAGAGTVAGGHAGLLVDPDLLAHLCAGRRVALVSGTNGKTTTTRLLAVALGAALGPVATNSTGSNMPTGHVTALGAAGPGVPAVLEVDEGYLPALVDAAAPEAVVLLNLSRDQLDRTNEVRKVAARWREALAAPGDSGPMVVANADDPLVSWAASTAPRVTWVAAGMAWRADAVGCPACEGRVEFFDDGRWACACGFARPAIDVRVEGDGADAAVVLVDGRRLGVSLRLPGHFNRTNAAMAGAGAAAMGVGWEKALAAMAGVESVEGRFGEVVVGDAAARAMLAKNPAGFQELLDLICPGTGPVVVAINARIADGRDPSWLWDVAFERLAGRPVVAAGERCRDLGVRLRYAEVAHRTVADPVAAVRAAAMAAGPGWSEPVVYVGNYTAFSDLLQRARAVIEGAP